MFANKLTLALALLALVAAAAEAAHEDDSLFGSIGDKFEDLTDSITGDHEPEHEEHREHHEHKPDEHKDEEGDNELQRLIAEPLRVASNQIIDNVAHYYGKQSGMPGFMVKPLEKMVSKKAKNALNESLDNYLEGEEPAEKEHSRKKRSLDDPMQQKPPGGGFGRFISTVKSKFQGHRQPNGAPHAPGAVGSFINKGKQFVSQIKQRHAAKKVAKQSAQLEQFMHQPIDQVNSRGLEEFVEPLAEGAARVDEAGQRVENDLKFGESLAENAVQPEINAFRNAEQRVEQNLDNFAHAPQRFGQAIGNEFQNDVMRPLEENVVRPVEQFNDAADAYSQYGGNPQGNFFGRN